MARLEVLSHMWRTDAKKREWLGRSPLAPHCHSVTSWSPAAEHSEMRKPGSHGICADRFAGDSSVRYVQYLAL